MREIELPVGSVTLHEDSYRMNSGRITGGRYFVEIDPTDNEGAYVGRRKDGKYICYSMPELYFSDVEDIRTKKQVDNLAREIMSHSEPEPFYDDDGCLSEEEEAAFMDEMEREAIESNKLLERQRERALHPFKKREPDDKVRARYVKMWNSRNVRNGQLELEPEL